MKRLWLWTIVIIVLVAVAGVIAYSSMPQNFNNNEKLCSSDSDCVPKQCCHPTECINSAYKSVCNLLCTAVCEGPLDCGAGHCGCVSGSCAVIPGTGQ